LSLKKWREEQKKYADILPYGRLTAETGRRRKKATYRCLSRIILRPKPEREKNRGRRDGERGRTWAHSKGIRLRNGISRTSERGEGSRYSPPLLRLRRDARPEYGVQPFVTFLIKGGDRRPGQNGKGRTGHSALEVLQTPQKRRGEGKAKKQLV